MILFIPISLALMLLSFFTGLAYSDTYYLTEEHLYKANDGKMWIKKPRQKTKVIADIPLLEVPLQILDKYRGQQTGGRLLPVCSNQKVNQYLKELATVCGINKELTYHVARYTFATSLTLLHDVPMASIAKMLGHTNIRQTQHYAKATNILLSRSMQNLSEQLNLRMEIK